MSSIDERVVEMEFKNSQFERGIKTSQASLDHLKKNLDMKSAAKSLDSLNDAGKRFNLGGLGTAVDNIGVRFGAMQVMAVSALASITTKAVDAGLQLAKSLTVEPIVQGLQEYETQLNSVQTIMSNTRSKGTTLDDVNGALKELNDYADLTIYNFSEMTRNIGTFTAAGVDLDTATNAIKGIANLAAVSGSNSQQASTAMYQLSQAMASGTVKLMDWNSVVNAGMGGQVFQDALTETARVSGVKIDEMIKKNGSFRESLQEGWLTSTILTDTLAKFTGELTDAQLESQGYTKEQIADIRALGEDATNAATKVKTATQLIDVLKEAVGSGWAQTWQTVFGDFEEAKTLWTSASDTLTGLIGDASDARNKLLAGWKKGGGRDLAIEAVANAFDALMTAMEPIKEAWNEVFPPLTAKKLIAITQSIADFTEKLKMGEGTIAKVKSIFKGFFSALDIGRMVLQSAWEMLKNLFGKDVTDGASSLFDTLASVGDWITDLRDALKSGDDIGRFFEDLGGWLSIPVGIVRALGDAFAWLWDKITNTDASGSVEDLGEKVEKRLEPLVKLADWLAEKWEAFKGVLKRVWDEMKPFTDFMKEAFGTLANSVRAAFEDMDFNTLLDAVNTGLLGGLVLLVKKFVDSLGGDDGGGLGGLVDSIKGVFGGLTDTLSTMQGTLKAGTLFLIASAVGILTASVIGLSLIDPAKLASALAGLTAMFLQLLGAMAIFEKISNSKGFLRMPMVAAALILLSTAVLILSAAVRNLSGLDWGELARGLAGVTALLAALAGTAQLMKGTGKGMIVAGAGLILVAVAIRILVSAVKEFSEMSWENLAKGLTGVAAILVSLGIFAKLASTGGAGIAQGAGILLMAYGIKVLAEAVISMSDLGWEEIGKGIAALGGIFAVIAGFSRLSGNGANLILSAAGMLIMGEAIKSIADGVGKFIQFSWEELGRGLGAMALALGAIAVAIGLLPPSSLLSAAAIFVVAQSLGMITDAVSVGAGMEWEEIGKGLVVLAGSLAIIAGALYLMTAALPGAAALLVAAAAISVLMPVIEHMGTLKWGQIGTGLGALAAALGIMALAGILLLPAIPGLVGLGIALGLIGAGIALAGVGIMAFATGLATLAVAATAGVAAITAIGGAIINLIPMALAAVGQGIVQLAVVLGENAPVLIEALVNLIFALLEGIQEVVPKIVEVALEIIWLLTNTLLENIEELTAAGLQILTGFLNGIADNIGDVVDAASRVIVEFLNGLARNIDDIVVAGGDLIVSFLEGMAENIEDVVTAALGLIVAIIEGLDRGIGDIIDAGGNLIINFITGLGSKAAEIASAALDVLTDFLTELGSQENVDKVITAGTDLVLNWIEGFGQASADIITGVGDTMLEFLTAIDNWITANKSELLAKGRSIADNVISGFGEAMGSFNPLSMGWSFGKGFLTGVTNAFDINSPSREMKKIGEFVNKGFAQGLNGGTKQAVSDAFWAMSDNLKSLISSSKKEMDDAAATMKRLEEQGKKNTKEWKDAQKALAAATEENKKATTARKYLLNQLDDEREKLKKLAKEYGEVSEELEKAKDKLADAKNERDSFRKSIKDDNDNFADFNPEEQSLTEYLDSMREQVDKTAAVRAGLEQLAELGLNDKLYKQLAEGGVDSLPFIEELLNGGKGAVLAINDINKDLNSVSSGLGKDTSEHLYQAGVDAAKGLVEGLKAEKQSLKKQMEEIADYMVDAIKKKLEIKSPSRVFKKVGAYAGEGIAVGVKSTSDMVAKATEDVGEGAMDALRAVMSDIGNGIYDDINLDPTIKPIVDLSEVRSGASKINSFLASRQIDLGTSADAAASTAAAVRDTTDGETDEGRGPRSNVTFNQYNNSPKALSEAEIYRNTNNQIAKAKGALTNA